MKIEIEAKCRVDDLAVIQARVEQLNGEHVAEMLEENIFLDNHDRQMAAADCGLRVRVLRVVSNGGACETVVTFKGPRQHGKLKSRREIEVTVDTAPAMLDLLAELGYNETIRFEKRRDRWRLDGCTIELDELPILGCFVEIEGPDDETVLRVRERLGLSDRPMIKSSYVSMLWSHLTDNDMSERHITFEPVV